MTPSLERALQALASRFYSDIPADQRPQINDLALSIRTDMRSMKTFHEDHPEWRHWLNLQLWQVNAMNRELQHPRSSRLSGEDFGFLVESAMHQHLGDNQLSIPWSVVEHVTSWKIDRNICVQDLVNARLPDSLWIDITDHPTTQHQPWIAKTIGILLSKLMLLDAPRKILRDMLQQPTREDRYDIEVVRALTQNVIDNKPSLAYRMTIVQTENAGYRFTSSFFGHEHSAEVTDMLRLHREASEHDKRKYKEMSQVWCNAGIRLLLFCASQQAFTGNASHVVIPSNVRETFPEKNHAFFAQKGDRGRRIAIKPEYHVPYKPFRIEGM